MKRIETPVWIIGLLILTTLACAQAGEILTPEEATLRAEEAISFPISGGNGGVEGAIFGPGDTATIVGNRSIVNLHVEPAGRITAGLQRGADVTIVDSALADNEIWYSVESPGGDGWLPAEILAPIEGQEPTGEGGGESGTGSETAFSPGDTAYLAAPGFLANLYREPGGIILAVQNKGAEAEILEVTEHEGKNWYLVRVSAGEGWVPEEGLSADPP